MVWKNINGHLTKEFEFNNFAEAIDFVNKIAPLAERKNHHPDIFIHSYKKVRIMLFTHSENKISEKDYSMSREIDRLQKQK